MLIIAGINVLILSGLFLIVGMIKPGWLLFWMDKPSRLAIVLLVSLLAMVGVTLFGEGGRQKQLEIATSVPKSTDSAPVIPAQR